MVHQRAHRKRANGEFASVQRSRLHHLAIFEMRVVRGLLVHTIVSHRYFVWNESGDDENGSHRQLLLVRLHWISLFYQSLGKYSQIMQIFKLIGFRRIDRNICTAFNHMKDPEDEVYE